MAPKDPLQYTKRKYRNFVSPEGLVPSVVKVRETDLQIMAPMELRAAATHLIIQYRNQLEDYIAAHPDFLTSLTPLHLDRTAPRIIKAMMEAALRADVGPMAAVAGAIAEFVGSDLLRHEKIDEIIVENGGDIFLHRQKESVISIFAGSSPLTHRIGIKLAAAESSMGVCTSSGTIGHSLSLGEADSVTVVSPSVCLADAVATRLGNELKRVDDIPYAIEIASNVAGVNGVLMVMGDRLGAWGEIEIVEI